MSDDLRDRLAVIRAAHQWNFATLYCSCGEGAFITREEHDAHYHIDAVLPLVREAQAALIAERDILARKVAAVEALCDATLAAAVYVTSIRAALAVGGEPTDLPADTGGDE